jgi:hypothetical protein
MAVFACQQCDHVQSVDNKHIGKTATCPKCKAQGMVDLDSAFKQAAPIFVPVEEKKPSVLHVTAGPLGIRCDSWVDHERHINRASSLQVEWWTVVDENLPVRFDEATGLLIHNKARDYPLDLVYRADPVITCKEEPVVALEVKYMTFNVWGEHVSTLAAVRVRDMRPEQGVEFDWSWHLFSETEAEEYCASLAFISRAKLATGGVAVANPDFVVREARRLCERVTEADLQPKPPQKDS